MIVVSDTSAISNLAAIGQLILLKQLYNTVVIPNAVHKELIGSPAFVDNEPLSKYDWIQVRDVRDRALVKEYLEELDIGESEAIALALEIKAELLLLDEKDGRRIAKEKGLKRTGILGVLTEAKNQTLISEIRPLIKTLRNQTNFWLSKSLCNEVLNSVGEKLL